MSDASIAAQSVIAATINARLAQRTEISHADLCADRCSLDGAHRFALSAGDGEAAYHLMRAANRLYAVPFGSDPRPVYERLLADIGPLPNTARAGAAEQAMGGHHG